MDCFSRQLRRGRSYLASKVYDEFKRPVSQLTQRATFGIRLALKIFSLSFRVKIDDNIRNL